MSHSTLLLQTFLTYAFICICTCGVTNKDQYTLSHRYTAIGFNFRQRFLILHYTAVDLSTSLKILTGHRVSSHYVVPKEAIKNKRIIYQLVPEEKRAWTNGISYWRGRNNLNDQAIGVEIVNEGYKDINNTRKWIPYTNHQIDSVIQLSKDVIQRYSIDPTNVFGHSDCSPGRKVDPGPLFPWKRLYDNGIGAWPDDRDIKEIMTCLPDQVNVKEFQLGLRRYGYNINTDGIYTKQTRDVVIAFQMHFRQSNFDGVIDKETVATLKALLKKYRP